MRQNRADRVDSVERRYVACELLVMRTDEVRQIRDDSNGMGATMAREERQDTDPPAEYGGDKGVTHPKGKGVQAE